MSHFLEKTGPSLASFSFILGLFQTNFTRKFVKNVCPVYCIAIRTHTTIRLQVSAQNH